GGVDDVQAVADLIGLKGTVTTRGEFSSLIGATGAASLQHNGMRAWSVYRAPPDANCTTSSDGSTSCSGSGVASPAMACASPPCGPNQSCPEAAKCVPPEPPARPGDLPTKAGAE